MSIPLRAPRSSNRIVIAGILLSTATAGCTLEITDSDDISAPGAERIAEAPAAVHATCTDPQTFTFQTSGDDTTAFLGTQPVAWFTAGAYTVRMAGPARTFTWGDPLAVTLTQATWVRTLAAPFDPATPTSTLTSWLNAARAVNCDAPTGTPDIVAIAFDYVEGASLDASHEFGADFHDYLGTSWQPPDGSRSSPDPAQLGKLDCSGYMRLVWGSRANFFHDGVDAKIPLSLHAYADAIPRDSRQQYMYGPGKLTLPFRVEPTGGVETDGGAPTASEIALLQVGDLVFFDLSCDYSLTDPTCSTDPATAISHVGIYLGADTGGHLRFISSRRSSDGPTIGNLGGWSVVDPSKSSTYFPKRFRAARRF